MKNRFCRLTPEIPRNRNGYGVSSVSRHVLFFHFWGEFGVNVLRKPIRDLGGLRFCGGYDVGIDVAGGACLRVPKVFRYDHQRGPLRDQEAGVCVPLRYNNDKRKKPLFSRGLSVCRHLFNSFSKLKHGEKNIEKRRLFH